jgi:molecular chaperone DnaK (HSP70)
MDNFDADFILGVDLGDDTSAIACFNARAGKPEAVDLSGGYGKPSVPTVLQYLRETGEWVFGEYAVLNDSAEREVTLSGIIKKLGQREWADLGEKPLDYPSVLGVYIKELIKNVKTLNPNADIAAIAAATPSYAGEETKSGMRAAFKAAGLEKELIGLVSDRQCLFGRYYFEQKPVKGTIMTLDFGSRETRAGIYEAVPSSGTVRLNCVSSFFDANIGTNAINEGAQSLFARFYRSAAAADAISSANLTEARAKAFIAPFSYRHRDLLFQKAPKPLRLYFNFAYPSAQYNMSAREIKEFIQPFESRLIGFIETSLGKAGLSRKDIAAIDAVICVGGGFEMEWAKKLAREFFGEKRAVFYKNAKTATAEGAAIIAAARIGAVKNFTEIIIRDSNQLRADIGLKVSDMKREKFAPLAERNSFWWQEHSPKYVILDEKTDDPVTITLWKRNAAGETARIHDVTLYGLPKRPRGVTKLKLAARFDTRDNMTLLAEDCGFGEMFPKADYLKEFVINVGEQRITTGHL